MGSFALVLRLWAALLIAMIGLQSYGGAQAMDFGQTDPRHGSTFSVANDDAALVTRPGDVRQIVREAPPPDPLTSPPAPAFVNRTIAVAHPAAPFHAEARAPPARDLLNWRPAPRGPPAA